MKRFIINIAALIIIAIGGYSLSTPDVAYACPDCRTCTGGCTGCFSADCDGTGKECGKIQNASTGEIITCKKNSGGPSPEEN